MRPILLVSLLSLAACADFFNPPCTRLGKVVCDIPDEGDTCAFVLDIGRNDRQGQAMCEAVLPAAKERQEKRGDPAAIAGWVEARTKLASLGMKTDPMKGRIETKLKASGGEAGRMVQKLEDSKDLEEQRVQDGAGKAFEDAQH